MRHTWEQRIRRTNELLEQQPDSEVLKLYRDVLAVQREIAATALPATTAKDPERLLLDDFDFDAALVPFPQLLEVVEMRAPAKLCEQARQLRTGTKEQRRAALMLAIDGTSESAAAFLGRMLLQPLVELLALESTRKGEHTGRYCPACGSQPQLAILYPEGDGGKRYLACSLCFSEWEFRRVLCPACGETEYTKLPRFTPDGASAVRVEGCETCKSYLKSFDLTVNGLMVAEADEMASVALDVWASQQGYRKIRANVMGF